MKNRIHVIFVVEVLHKVLSWMITNVVTSASRDINAKYAIKERIQIIIILTLDFLQGFGERGCFSNKLFWRIVSDSYWDNNESLRIFAYFFKIWILIEGFIHHSTLSRHKQVHLSQEKNYSCDLCDMSFARKDVLVNHQKIHTGEKPYSCEECGKQFAQESVLKNCFVLPFKL